MEYSILITASSFNLPFLKGKLTYNRNTGDIVVAKGYYRHSGVGFKENSGTRKIFLSTSSSDIMGNCFEVKGTRTGILKWLYERKKWIVINKNPQSFPIYISIVKEGASAAPTYAKEVGGAILGGGTHYLRGSVAAVSLVSAGAESGSEAGNLGFRVAEHNIKYSKPGHMSHDGSGYSMLERATDKTGWCPKFHLRISIQGSAMHTCFAKYEASQIELGFVWNLARDSKVW